jgi:hypothetical protein
MNRGRDRIVIANCGGFWGDDPTAAQRQVEGGPIDYLVMDYLAEVTMAVLQKQRRRRPEGGFASDFLVQLRDVLPACVERGIRIISNAGGLNLRQCRKEVNQLAAELGLGDRVTVGLVLGDDIHDALDDLGEPLEHMDTGRPLSDVRDRVLSANVYLGAAPVAQALEMGANVVITGRVADAAVTLAPMIFEFGWAADDWDRLAAGTVAGHIIECGTQCTGGNFTDWRTVESFDDMGYPLVEARADGTFTVTKHPDTGGLVNVHTVSEQLLYEIGAPAYVAPDCVAHFDSIRLEQEGPDRVRVSINFSQGYRAFGRLMIAGPDALAKARRVAEVFWQSAGGEDFYADADTRYIGWNAAHPPVGDEPGEVLLQVAVRDDRAAKIRRHFAPQLVPKVLSTVPGITYLADQGRPRASGVIGHWPALIPRKKISMRVVVGEEAVTVPHGPTGEAAPFPAAAGPAPPEWTGCIRTAPLSRFCLARSGDKGDICNIGVIARSPAIYAWIRDHLTAEFVRERFAGICKGEVERFELPNLLALNFLLHESLGGGGMLSLLLDTHGKTYAHYLLSAAVEMDEALL